MGQITFGDYTVTSSNFFKIAIHYSNIVLTSTVAYTITYDHHPLL